MSPADRTTAIEASAAARCTHIWRFAWGLAQRGREAIEHREIPSLAYMAERLAEQLKRAHGGAAGCDDAGRIDALVDLATASKRVAETSSSLLPNRTAPGAF